MRNRAFAPFAFEIGRVGRSCFEKEEINALITRGFGEHAAAMEDVAGVLSKNERLTLRQDIDGSVYRRATHRGGRARA
jgi:hypothetical protein